jgi:putative ABC transport system permease protein
MWKNYLKTAIRNLFKHKGHSLINIFGLAVGMAASLLIFLYVHKELSYDMFHSKADRIHRVLFLDKSLGVSNTYAGITFTAMGPEIPEDIPEVEAAARIMFRGRQAVQVEEQRFNTEEMVFADPAIFKIFDFPLVNGDPDTALNEPYTAVLSREIAMTLYGTEDVLGRTFMWGENQLRVTGLSADIPDTSHLQFDVLVSLNFPDEEGGFGERLRTWNLIAAPTYFLLRQGATTGDLEEKLIGVLRKNDVGENFSVTHQPLKEAHLQSKNVLFDRHNKNKGDRGYVYTLAAVALFILLIAIFNFMNLSTARSHSRAREVGMRKVVGARRRQLIGQFLGESLLLCFVGVFFALGLAALAVLYLNSAHGMRLSMGVLTTAPAVAVIFGGAAATGLLAGSWPALVLSSFRPQAVLRGRSPRGGQGMGMRLVLVVVQFSISIALIIGSGVVFQQIKFIKNKDVGYDREQVLTISLNPETAQRFQPLTERLEQSPAILSWCASGNVPGRGMGRTGIQPDGVAQTDPWVVSVMSMDENFLETMGIELVAGRNFSPEFGTDAEQAVILNQAAVEAIGWEDPIGKTFNDGRQTVVGVIADFHFATLRHVVEPLMISYRPGGNGLLSLKLREGSIPQGMAHLRQVWEELLAGHPLEYVFLDEEFDQIYRREQGFGSLARGFTFLAIFIACLGLFGLASHTVEQRTKEIGIRKVLGAGFGGLVVLLSRTYLKLVLLANLIAWPAAYFLMRRWLQDFVYRVDLGVAVFLVSMLAAFAIALFTVSYHSIRAAVSDPVRALRYE